MWQRINNIICYILLYLCIILLAVFYRQPFFVFACLLLTFLPFLSYFAIFHTAQRLTLSLSSPSLYGIKGSRFPLIIKLHNPTLFPVQRAEITLHVSSPFYANPNYETIIIPLLAHSHNEQRFMLTYEKLGCYQIQAVKVVVHDYLNFFSFPLNTDSRLEIKILPQAEKEIEFHDAFYTEGFEEFEDVSQGGFTTADVTDIREYIPGDRLQKIHWKLSSKIGKWVVKESKAGATHSFIVLLELYLNKEIEHCDFLDCSLENAYAICRELLYKGEPFVLMTYAINRNDFISFHPRNQGDIETAFEQLFYEHPYDTPNLSRQYFETLSPAKGTILHVTHEGIYNEEISET